MDKRTYRLSERYGNRLKLDGRIAESRTGVSTGEDKNVCVHCGADLPSDIPFQEFHMQKEHGLIV